MRAAARPSVRLAAAFLHAACVLFGPGLHLWEAGSCGCGHSHAPKPERRHSDCGHGQCCHHGHGHSGSHDHDEGKLPEAPSPHDPDDCHVCQQLALARIAAPTVRLTLVAFDAPLVARPLPPLRPALVAADVLCRGPPAPVTHV